MYIQTWGPLQLMYDNCVLNCKERERERKPCILKTVQVTLADLEGQTKRDKKRGMKCKVMDYADMK